MRIFLYLLQAGDPNTLWMPLWSRLHTAQRAAADEHNGAGNHPGVPPGLVNDAHPLN